MKKAMYKDKEVYAWENQEAGEDMWLIQSPNMQVGITVHSSQLVFL